AGGVAVELGDDPVTDPARLVVEARLAIQFVHGELERGVAGLDDFFEAEIQHAGVLDVDRLLGLLPLHDDTEIDLAGVDHRVAARVGGNFQGGRGDVLGTHGHIDFDVLGPAELAGVHENVEGGRLLRLQFIGARRRGHAAARNTNIGDFEGNGIDVLHGE